MTASSFYLYICTIGIGKFNFKPKKLLNKALIFDNSRIDKEKIIDKIIKSLSAFNDEHILNMSQVPVCLF